MKTQYLVLPHKLGPNNKLVAQQAQACRTEGEALRAGERLSRSFAGVVVLSQEFDETADFAADPVVLAVTVEGR